MCEHSVKPKISVGVESVSVPVPQCMGASSQVGAAVAHKSHVQLKREPERMEQKVWEVPGWFWGGVRREELGG